MDDFSDNEDLGQKLDDYVKTMPLKVVVVRMMKRAGLIQAKILAAKYVTVMNYDQINYSNVPLSDLTLIV